MHFYLVGLSVSLASLIDLFLFMNNIRHYHHVVKSDTSCPSSTGAATVNN